MMPEDSGCSRVYLIGFAGSGKSTVGRLLAKRLGWIFIDTDMLIEHTIKMSIGELFAQHGETSFRVLETSVIREVAQNPRRPAVVALGGGAVTRTVNRRLLKRSGTVVYLSCPVRELYRRLKRQHTRPLLESGNPRGVHTRKVLMARIKILLDERKRYYGTADVRVSVAGKTPARIAAELQKRLMR